MRQSVSEALRYARIWRRAITLHFGTLTASRADFFFFFAGKVLRMAFFLVFFLSLFSLTKSIAGYGQGEVLMFFATMNLIDVLVQLIWYRGLTVLPRLVRRGDFDLLLTKPVSPLFMTAFHIFDFFDLTTLPVAVGLLWYAFSLLPPLAAAAWFSYWLFFLSGLALAFALNLALASLAFYAVESSNLWWLYRDLVYVARFPPEVFPKGVRIFFTFVVPILVIVSFPTKAAIGRLTLPVGLYALSLTLVCLILSLKFWRRAVRSYSSASS